MFNTIVSRTKRVPIFQSRSSFPSINKEVENDLVISQVATRQLDLALMKSGFKLSNELFDYLSYQHSVVVRDLTNRILPVVKEMIGDHVKHNAYFKDFPKDIPETKDFWSFCIVDALMSVGKSKAEEIFLDLSSLGIGSINLLDLPRYGSYFHSYEDMVKAHKVFIPILKESFQILHLGNSLKEEAISLYLMLANSMVPLNESDRKILEELAEICLDDPNQPKNIPVRENRAIINKVFISNNRPLIQADTITDVLRLACALSPNGDLTLETKTKFASLKRSVRRNLLNALNVIIKNDEWKLADVNRYSEEWKRLGEFIHVGEFKNQYPYAMEVFSVARGDRTVRTLAGKIELAFKEADNLGAITLLSEAPGMLFRSVDRLLNIVKPEETTVLLETIARVSNKVSGRVLLSLREHLMNRVESPNERIRTFANSSGKAWVESDKRNPLDSSVVVSINEIIDRALFERLPSFENLSVDPEMLDVALPLSEKNKSTGFGIMPRGSRASVDSSGIVRFFMYWKDANTDYDLSVILFDKEFNFMQQCSWTNLKGSGLKHSGDITSAPKGASEFIDVEFSKLDKRIHYIVPQVNVFRGQPFDTIEEAFFGFMNRGLNQEGLPYEPRTIKMKSDLRGKGKVGLPLVFEKDEDDTWSVKWLHLYLTGTPNFNRTESNKVSTRRIAKALIKRNFITLRYLKGLLARKEVQAESGNSTVICLQKPEGLTKDSKVFTLDNLIELIPG